MKHLGLLLIGTITLVTILGIAIFSLMTEEASPQDIIVVPVDPTITSMENALATQEAAYQTQLYELEQTLHQQQADFQNRLETLTSQIAAAQQQLIELKSQEQQLASQLKLLDIRRAQQQSRYETNLQQAREQYLARQTQLQAQIDAAQAELTTVNDQLIK